MTQDDFNELRKDRDHWRRAAKRLKIERDALEVELANLRRKRFEDARRAARLQSVFSV